MEIWRQPSPIQFVIHQKHPESMEYFKYVGSVITSDARRTREIQSRIDMAKAVFNRKKTLFTSKLDLNLKKKLAKCHIWSIALFGAETWTLRKVDQKYLERFEMWCWIRMEKIRWTDRVRNEDVTHRVKEERNTLHTTKEGKLTGLVTSWVGTAFWNTFLKVRWMEGWTWREDEEEDVSSSWMTLKKRKDTANWKRMH